LASLLHQSILAWSDPSTENSLPDVVEVCEQNTCDERVTVLFGIAHAATDTTGSLEN